MPFFKLQSKNALSAFIPMQLAVLLLAANSALAQDYWAESGTKQAGQGNNSLTDLVQVRFNDTQPPAEVKSASHLQLGESPDKLPVTPGLAPKQVTLSYGMHRRQILNTLGEPSFESIIGSLKRMRADYDNRLELLFEQNQLIGVRIFVEATMVEQGMLEAKLTNKTVVFPDELLLQEFQRVNLNPQHVDYFFFFGPSLPASGALSNHFTPSCITCLENSCFGPLRSGYCWGHTNRCNSCRR
ncbi:MAG: hypothetical protein AAF483_02000 [Planctomycetota bacterium]